MANSREELLTEFIDWAAQHITGDEKARSGASRNVEHKLALGDSSSETRTV